MDLQNVKAGTSIGVVFFGGGPDPRTRKRTVVKALKDHLVLSAGYKYKKVNGKCLYHNYVIVEVN